MATVAEITTRVETNIIDLPASVQSQTAARIAHAHRLIQRATNFFVQQGTLSYPTTALSPTLGTLGIEQFKAWRGRPYATDDLGHTIFMDIVYDEQAVRSAYNVEPSLGFGEPKNILVKNSDPGDLTTALVLEAYPIPDGLAQTATGEYAIKIPYYKFLDLPASGSSDWFTIHADQYIEAQATAELFTINWDEARASYWMQLAQAEKRSVVAENVQLMTSLGDTMVPYKGVNSPRTRR